MLMVGRGKMTVNNGGKEETSSDVQRDHSMNRCSGKSRSVILNGIVADPDVAIRSVFKKLSCA